MVEGISMVNVENGGIVCSGVDTVEGIGSMVNVENGGIGSMVNVENGGIVDGEVGTVEGIGSMVNVENGGIVTYLDVNMVLDVSGLVPEELSEDRPNIITNTTVNAISKLRINSSNIKSNIFLLRCCCMLDENELIEVDDESI